MSDENLADKVTELRNKVNDLQSQVDAAFHDATPIDENHDLGGIAAAEQIIDIAALKTAMENLARSVELLLTLSEKNTQAISALADATGMHNEQISELSAAISTTAKAVGKTADGLSDMVHVVNEMRNGNDY